MSDQKKSLADFLNNKQDGSVKPTLLLQNLDATVMSSLGVIGIGTEKEKADFSNEINSMVTSKAFINDLSTEVGMPRENETKEEFVKRSSDILRGILYKKFGIK